MADWQKIRETYEAKQETVKDICTAFGVHAAVLYKKAQEEGWVLRSGKRTQKRKKDAQDETNKAKVAGAGKSPTKKSKPANIQSQKGSNRKALIDRLYKAFDHQMHEFEAHLCLSDDEGINEKDARTLGSLARTLEKLIELRDESEGDNNNKNNEVDIERLREELARRLKQLCPKGQTK